MESSRVLIFDLHGYQLVCRLLLVPKPLTADQLEVLRAVPLDGLGGAKNRIRLAIALSGAMQRDISTETGIHTSNLSGIVTGRLAGVHVETARKLATYFGCQIEDLFPAREAIAS